jgi:hypothetical protein
MMRWIGALAVVVLGAAAARADEVYGTFRHGALTFEAVDAMAFFNEPHGLTPGVTDHPAGSPFHVLFADFKIDREDALGAFDTDDAVRVQARRAGGRVIHVGFQPPLACWAPSVAFPEHQPRIKQAREERSPSFRATARTVGDRVIGRCEGRSAPGEESFAFEFRVDLIASVKYALAPTIPPTHGPGGGEPGAVLQALIAAIAARDLATVRRHHGGELPPESADAAAIDRFFDILSRTYPRNVVVKHAWVKETAARLVVEGDRLGHALEGTIELRRKKGEPWRVTDFHLGGPMPKR